ncbi:hypothetical protein ACQ33O_13350 [Ferruginibacter sp. SUN002]|uniref:hypothetical protein n=1 Tax=Ferruginibacter sp. SUN002 TaxID=2937789 RepID=UPI003D366D90
MQSAVFETEKNRKAFIYTAIICAVILLLAFIITWPNTKIPPPPPPVDIMEINLGAAFGPLADEIGGGSSPAASTTNTKSNNDEEDAAQQDAAEDNIDEGASVAKNTRPSTSKVTPTKQVTNPTPKAPTAKAVMGANNSKTPGTQTDGFGDGRGKGDGIGDGPGPGKGGGSGGSSFSKIKGVGPLNPGALRFEDDFSENAKVYIDVKYDSEGKFISATTIRGTTTTNATILRIAKQKVSVLKFPPSLDGGITTFLLNFKVN